MKKISIILLLLVFILNTGFGCKGTTQEQAQAVKNVKLEYWTVYNDVAELQKLVKEYQQLRPYVSVNIRQLSYDEFDQKFTTALADDVAPDIVSQHITWLSKNKNRLDKMPTSVKMARFYDPGKFQDVQIVIDTISMPNKSYVERSMVKSVFDNVIKDGEIYGLPMAVDSLAIYYNQDLLDRAGVAEVPTNWDQFVEAVKKTTKFDSSGNIIQSGVALGTAGNIINHFDILSLFMIQSGVKMVNNNKIAFADALKGASRSHPVLKAIDFYISFAQQTKEVYSWNDKKNDSFSEFTRGNSAFYIGYAYDYPTIKKVAPQLNIKISPMFQLNPENPSNISNFWVESVVAKSNKKNEAWDFVRFLTSAETVKKYTDTTFRPSPYRAHIVEQQKNEEMAPFANQALFAENWYTGSNVEIAKNAFRELIEGVNKEASDEKTRLNRDINLVSSAASKIQQTF